MDNYKIFFQEAKTASRSTTKISEEQTSQVLRDVAANLKAYSTGILSANEKDLAQMLENDPKYDRLKLSEDRINAIAGDLENVASLASSIGQKISQTVLENGLELTKIRVPLGVVGVIYEARPNVTADVFSLCFKTGNVAVLKGGSDAEFSNQAIAKIIHEVLQKHNLDKNLLTLLPAERGATDAMLNARDFVDVIIPRGSQSLIDFVRENSKIPVIETGAGIVHTYFDKSGDLEKGQSIVLNAKTRRVSVCNALDCLLVHQDRLSDLAELLTPLAEKDVTIYADEASYKVLSGIYPKVLLEKATPEHFGTEFLSLKMAVKVVQNLEAALDHINLYSSKHSEAVVAEDLNVIAKFLNEVDAAAVYANASTAFTDGGQFGLGAEIGISTQKLHARGPMGLEELSSYKWVVKGNGHVRA